MATSGTAPSSLSAKKTFAWSMSSSMTIFKLLESPFLRSAFL
eukprot:CAMPEP_0179617250 /NCGR_PEP_ID=MMETSP0930-20121108/7060_1 /TAXON_ID=548131 ORGANISM="Ostreococcus mediterraneus, Strain clade-D-RCC1621" /NCGR_SAMPLE_ID=MMETSP0930 /ASSEMBLY_ACC=CAM_ASM_000580 /LENGTH=41 /DNA_ID= /DNA_START= /DNA_END= /DNA_ORIENTATION=